MLTAKQEMFVQNLIKGMSQRDAYRSAYTCNGWKDSSIDCEACKLFNSPKILQRYKELQGQLQNSSIMTAKERLEYLSRVIKGEEPDKSSMVVNGELITVDAPATLRTKLQAVEIMNKMTGEYVQKIEATVDSVNVNVELVED